MKEQPKHSQVSYDTVIIGGGYTGLVAARSLAIKGFSVALVEKSSQAGGLAVSRSFGGGMLEDAYHHIFRTDTDIIELIKELNLEEKLTWQKSRTSLYFDSKLWAFAGAKDLLKFGPISPISRLRTGIGALYLSTVPFSQKLDEISAIRYMTKLMGRQSVEAIWKPLLKGKFHEHWEEVSMAWLWARISVRSRSKKKYELTERLGYFPDSFQILTSSLVDDCKSLGVDLYLGRTPSEIELDSESEKRFSLYLSGGEGLKCRSLLLTTPSKVTSLLTQKLPIENEYRKNLENIEYLGARVIKFATSQNLSNYYWHNINDLSLPFLVLINHTKLASTDNFNGKHIFYLAAYLPHDSSDFLETDAALVEKWFRGVKTIFPIFDKSKVTEVHVSTFSNAQHIVKKNYGKRIPNHNPLGGLFVYNFAQIFPQDRGTNFAVREGNDAGLRIAEYLISS